VIRHFYKSFRFFHKTNIHLHPSHTSSNQPTNLPTPTHPNNHPKYRENAPSHPQPKTAIPPKSLLQHLQNQQPRLDRHRAQADFATPKYARDQFALVKSKLLATGNGDPINLSDRQIALLKATVEGVRAEVHFQLAITRRLCTLYAGLEN
jgi:hypothetical protein